MQGHTRGTAEGKQITTCLEQLGFEKLPMGNDALVEISRNLSLTHYEPDELVTKQGSDANALYLVIDGSLECYSTLSFESGHELKASVWCNVSSQVNRLCTALKRCSNHMPQTPNISSPTKQKMITTMTSVTSRLNTWHLLGDRDLGDLDDMRNEPAVVEQGVAAVQDVVVLETLLNKVRTEALLLKFYLQLQLYPYECQIKMKRPYGKNESRNYLNELRAADEPHLVFNARVQSSPCVLCSPAMGSVFGVEMTEELASGWSALNKAFDMRTARQLVVKKLRCVEGSSRGAKDVWNTQVLFMLAEDATVAGMLHEAFHALEGEEAALKDGVLMVVCTTTDSRCIYVHGKFLKLRRAIAEEDVADDATEWVSGNAITRHLR